ncbi:MAG: hypothetical protein MZV63_34460 [Marinilabiliales bacterium]|nr:hypothetical protein [Marinilabiliales bacterium]
MTSRPVPCQPAPNEAGVADAGAHQNIAGHGRRDYESASIPREEFAEPRSGGRVPSGLKGYESTQGWAFSRQCKTEKPGPSRSVGHDSTLCKYRGRGIKGSGPCPEGHEDVAAPPGKRYLITRNVASPHLFKKPFAQPVPRALWDARKHHNTPFQGSRVRGSGKCQGKQAENGVQFSVLPVDERSSLDPKAAFRDNSPLMRRGGRAG